MHEILGHGANKASARFGLEGIQVDVRALAEENRGAAMQYFTGSKEHNVALRQRAQRMGLTLNEYALSRLDNGEAVASRSEQEIYTALSLDWIPPEMRENTGEIDAAERHELPALLELSDIRGDVHMHTRESDGRGTLEEMAAAAQALGYAYVAITDHSKSLAMTNGLDERRAVAFAAQVRKFNAENGKIRVFSGLECDILRDGRMDLSEDALAELDYVIASVHSYMNLDGGEMTDRLLRVFESPSVKAFGHPTGACAVAPRSVCLRLRPHCSGGRTPRRLDGDQCEPGAARPARDADQTGQVARSEIRHFHRRASSEASGEHALRRDHGAPRLADER